jgi:peptidoglycan/xylan/chitin deacetylase (PgdA/CDA1 family)
MRSVAMLETSRLADMICPEPLLRVADRFFGGFVLAFHNLPAVRFERLVDALKSHEPVHLDELVARVKAGRQTKGLCAITVDDGVGDNVRGIASVAVKRQWPVTFYLPTRYLDERRGMPFQWLDSVLPGLPYSRLKAGPMELDLSTSAARRRFEASMRQIMYTRPAREYVTIIDDLVKRSLQNGWASAAELAPPEPVRWEEVASLAMKPEIRFESHGVTHTAVSALSLAQLEAELLESCRRISDHTNRPCRHFCYPYGGPTSIGTSAPPVVARHFESAVTMSRGRVNRQNPMLLPRIPLYSRDTPAIARIKVLTC